MEVARGAAELSPPEVNNLVRKESAGSGEVWKGDFLTCVEKTRHTDGMGKGVQEQNNQHALWGSTH